jgi:hypothetical protein
MEANRRLAVNHTGWQVEVMTVGWKPIYKEPFTSYEAADSVRVLLKEKFPEKEFRVYEEVV